MAMMDCPRCGFSQPKDQFCANCGINMQAYEPAPKPVSQKLFSNPYLIGTLVTVILASMIWYLQSRSSGDPDLTGNTITRDEDFEKQRQEELAKAEEERRQRSVERREQRQQQAQKRQTQRSTINTQAINAQNPAAQAQSGSGDTPIPQAPKQLQMRFFEVPQNVLDQVYEKGREVSASSVSRTLIVSSAAELMAILQGAKSAGPSKSWTTLPGETQTANYTNLSDTPKAVNYDMNLEVLINRASGEGLSYQFRGDLYLAEGENTSSPIELPPETHQVPIKGAIVVVGFLPHEGLSEEAPRELLNPPLSVLAHPEFRTSETEFLIVLTPQ